jgi:hypothetical protein
LPTPVTVSLVAQTAPGSQGLLGEQYSDGDMETQAPHSWHHESTRPS